ncbi:MAG: WD40 repeat domain-containing protein, partial [Pirellula sp.]
ESINSAAIPKRKAGNNGFKPVSIVPAREFWSVKTPRAFPDVSFEDALIQTSLKKPFFAGIQVMGAGKVGTIILNSYQEGRNRDAFGRFVVASATTSESSSVLEFPDPWRLIAISPDGGRFAAVRVEGFDKGNDVAIFRVKDEVITPEFQFTAGGGSWDELHWAAFLPDNRFATISQKHDLTFWDLENKTGPKAIKRGSTGSALKASITPAGELMAYTAGNAVAVLDTTEGKLVGCIKREEPVYSVAFSPKADMIATLGPFKITLFGMNDGKEIRTVPINDSNPGAELLWLGKYLLVGNVLYDVERGVPLWTYETQAPRAVLGDFLLAGFGGDNSSSVGLFRLPHENAVRVAEEIDPATSYALRPGDSISVEYDFGATPPALQEKIREAVSAKILAVGWKLNNSDENVLTIKLEQGKSEEAEYFEHRGFGPMFHPFGGRPSGTGEKVTYTPWTHTMTLKSQGKQVFSNVYKIGAPQNLRDEKGVTTQSQVDSYCKPSPSYFTNAAIPPYMLKAEYQGGLGKSRVDASGLK